MNWNGNRFDLYAKYIYGYHRLHQTKGTWFIDLYRDLILVFNGGWEYPGDEKTSVEDFISAFDNLLQTQDKTLDVFVTPSGHLVNGSHRFVVCRLKQLTPTKQIVNNYSQPYNYDFFINRYKYPKDGENKHLIPRGLSPIWSDEIARQAIQLIPHTSLVHIFPCANREKQPQYEWMIQQHGTIFYKLEIDLGFQGLLNYIHELYYKEEWTGFTRQDKARLAYDKGGVITIYFIALEKAQPLTYMKREIRNLLGNQHAIHTTDTREEAIRCGNAILNENSRFFLKNGNQVATDGEKFQLFLKHYQYRDDVCLDGGMVLELFGIRPTRDVDVLCPSAVKLVEGVDRHPHQHYGKLLDVLLYDPREHFYVHGCKVLTLQNVLQMKRIRNEDKDKNDVNLIQQFLFNTNR